MELVHTKEHVEFMFSLESMGEEELQILQESYKSVYLHPKTNDCALLSAGCLLQVHTMGEGVKKSHLIPDSRIVFFLLFFASLFSTTHYSAFTGYSEESQGLKCLVCLLPSSQHAFSTNSSLICLLVSVFPVSSLLVYRIKDR